MDQRLDWIARNGVFAAALYFAIVERVGWLDYPVAAFIWWTLISSVWAIPESSASQRVAAIAVPQFAAIAFDLAVLGSMFLAQWYWTVFAYAVSRGCVALVAMRAASGP
jgi:hypothetical protein